MDQFIVSTRPMVVTCAQANNPALVSHALDEELCIQILNCPPNHVRDNPSLTKVSEHPGSRFVFYPTRTFEPLLSYLLHLQSRPVAGNPHSTSENPI
jgi:hypothetical protein